MAAICTLMRGYGDDDSREVEGWVSAARCLWGRMKEFERMN